MNISGVGSYAYSASRMSASGAGDSAPSTFASALSSVAGSSDQKGWAGGTTTDFTSMTRKDLFEWVNFKIKSGEIPLDDSSAFIGMTIKIPVNGAYAGLDDQETLNFMQTAQDGMAWAQHHNDIKMLTSLTSALAAMQQHQGQISGVDVKV